MINSLEYPRKHFVRYYLSQDEIDALEWLKKNTDEGAVLSSYSIGNYIPRFANNRVFIGHWAQTINYRQKRQELEQFFEGDDEFRRELLEKYNIKYVYFGENERALGSFDPETTNYLRLIYKNKSVKIFEVRL
jgi:uncharacterized membrane protein